MGHKILDTPGVTYPDKFSAVISVTSSMVTSSSPVFKLIKQLSGCDSLLEIVIVWTSDVKPPPKEDWMYLGRLSKQISLRVVHSNSTTRFVHASSMTTDAVLLLDEDVRLTTEEIMFAYEVWRTFPNRIVGFKSRNHFWDERKKMWSYSSAVSNEYSIILTNAAFLHRSFSKHFVENLSLSITSAIQSYPDCEHILINFLVSQITQQPPIKVTQQRENQEAEVINFALASEKFARKQKCMNIFYAGFGYMPLKKSKLRLDPVLFKDPVSNMRKKFRKIELVQ